MITTLVILIAGALVVLAIEVAVALRLGRKKGRLAEERQSVEKSKLKLESRERQFNEKMSFYRPLQYVEKVTIPADDKPSKKKARKSLASKFGYDVIDLMKIHETKNEDGSVTYSAELRFMYSGGDQR